MIKQKKKIKKRKTIIKTNMVFPSKELCNEETNENKKMEVDNERNGNMSVIFENGDKYSMKIKMISKIRK